MVHTGPRPLREADDFDESNGKTILTFFEAQDVAKKLARGEDGSAGTAPITVDGALTDYRRDLEARSANPYNAEHPRLHLTSVLLSKPVALLTATELKKWRDSLLGTMAPSTINRLCRCLCAALELAAQHDERIKNRRHGRSDLPDCRMRRRRATSSLSDDKVREFVAAAYGLDHQFGLLTDTLAVTGARPSQAVRLRVEDLHDHPVRPKLMMPKSAKGGGRNRSAEEDRALFGADHRAAGSQAEGGGERPRRRCAAAAAKRRQPVGQQSRPELSPPSGQGRHRHRARSCRGDDVRVATLQSIVRMLLAEHSDPAGGVACTTPASRMIEKHYSKYIAEYADEHARGGAAAARAAERRQRRAAGAIMCVRAGALERHRPGLTHSQWIAAMGKKAKGDNTIPEQPPLDDDAQWMPLLEAVERLIKQTSSKKVASPRIQKAMASGKLPNMREDDTTGERSPGSPSRGRADMIYYEKAARPYVHVFPAPQGQAGWNFGPAIPAMRMAATSISFRGHILSGFSFHRNERAMPTLSSLKLRSAPPASRTGHQAGRRLANEGWGLADP